MLMLNSPAPVLPDGRKVLAAIAFAGLLSSICEGLLQGYRVPNYKSDQEK